MPAYDPQDVEKCKKRIARKCRNYYRDLHAITAVWNWVLESSLPLGFQDYDAKIWVEDGEDIKSVRPDFHIEEEGEDHIFGEFKGSISDKSVSDSVKDVEKYTEEFHLSEEGFELEESNLKQATGVFFLAPLEHSKKIKEEFQKRHGTFDFNGVSVIFLGFQYAEDNAGTSMLDIEYIDGKIENPNCFNELKNSDLINPETNRPHTLTRLNILRNNNDFYFHDKKPPSVYTMDKLHDELNKTRGGNLKKDHIDVKRDKIIETFIDNHSWKDYIGPKPRWVEEALEELAERGWVTLDDNTVTIVVEKFRKKRRDEMYKFFASEQCREEAKRKMKTRKDRDKHASLDEFS